MEQPPIRPEGVNVAQNFDDIFKVSTTPEQPTVETPPEEVVVEETVETPPAQEQVEVQPTEYKKRLDTLIQDGILENFAIGIKDENGEDQAVLVSDLEEVDEETYKTIIESYKKAKDEEISEKYISTEGLDDITKKIIEVRKAGGNLADLIQHNVSAIDQWQNIKENLSEDEQLQINIVARELQGKGLSENVVKAQIQDFIDNLQLDAEAEKIVDFYLDAHKKEIDAKKQSELDRVNQEKETQKQTRKTLSSTYKEWKLPENIQKVLLDNATKTDENGLTNTEKLFFEAVKDPQKLAEINFMLNNPEEFKKFVSTKKVTQAKAEGLKVLFNINSKGSKSAKQTPDTVEERYAEAIEK